MNPARPMPPRSPMAAANRARYGFPHALTAAAANLAARAAAGLATLLAVAGLACAAPAGSAVVQPGPAQAEILWDTWGVPHIEAPDEPGLFHAFGWAQAHSHGDLVLRLYGQARGRAAYYWGAEHVEADRWLLVNGVPERAARWLDQQSPAFRANLEAFAAGINAYAAAHPERLAADVRQVLPVSATDVLAHLQRVMYFTFLTSRERALEEAVPRAIAHQPLPEPQNGSNAWAIGPGRAAGGHAMLLANPHLPWSGLYLFYEAQLKAPGVDVYGAALVGMPVIAIGFNDALGWTHTVNPLDGQDVYALAPAAGGYRWDGGVRAFGEELRVLEVRQADGSVTAEPLRIRHSVHGPVIRADAQAAYALRVPGLERGGLAEQWWAMAKARNREEFNTALQRRQIPMFNVVYADRDGHIQYLYNGHVPQRAGGNWEAWQGALDGTSSSTLWHTLHPYADLPAVADPPAQWLHNANDPPWLATLPAPYRPDAYPPYLAAPAMSLRAQRSASLVAGDTRITFDELLRYRHSTKVELASRVLAPLLKAAGKAGPAARRAAAVLRAWDRHADAHSRGAVLFMEWARETGLLRGDDSVYATPWQPGRPLATPSGLADPAGAVRALEVAAARVRQRHGALDVRWGDVARLRRGGHDLPASGGPGAAGIYSVLTFREGKDHRDEAVHGDTFVAAVEFSDPPRARTLLAYGNATQPGSAHIGDQLPLLAKKQMRPAWRSRADVLRHLARRERLACLPAPDAAARP